MLYEVITSLKTKIKLSITQNLKDSKGKAYKDDTFFGKYKDYYIAIICQHYNRNNFV